MERSVVLEVEKITKTTFGITQTTTSESEFFECNAARPLLTALSIIPAECKRRHGISGD